MSSFIQFTINGDPHTVETAKFAAAITLNSYIREHAQLTATKFMCLEGGCGVCACVVKIRQPEIGKKRILVVNTCLVLLNTCNGWEIITTEGIGNRQKGYHPIQKRLAERNGSQCGFCSPGFVMNMFALMESDAGRAGQLTKQQIESSFGGSICRCTGYRPILDAMKSFAMLKQPVSDIEDLCREPSNNDGGMNCSMSSNCTQRVNSASCKTAEANVMWHWPTTLSLLFNVLEGIPVAEEYILIAGGTAHGVQRRSANIRHFIYIGAIPELTKYAIADEAKLVLGANLTLTETMDIFLLAKSKSGFEYCQQLWQHFNAIASVPIRNIGTLAGNIVLRKTYADFRSDVYLLFEAVDAHIIFGSNALDVQRKPIREYMNSKWTKSVIIAFELNAFARESTIFRSYKIAPRAQNAQAIVNAAFLLQFDNTRQIVQKARICFGGIRPSFINAAAVEQLLIGKTLYAESVVKNVLQKLLDSLKPDEKLIDDSPKYRQMLACALFYRFLLNTATADQVKPAHRSGGEMLFRPLSSGSQKYKTIEKEYPITEPVEKLEALIQCAGEATYMNDVLTSQHTKYAALVTATEVGAHIESIDASAALQLEGVVAFYAAKDIPGENTFTNEQYIQQPEELFCSDVVKYYDQPIGVLVAVAKPLAEHAASLVRITYSNVSHKRIAIGMAALRAAAESVKRASSQGNFCLHASAVGDALVHAKGTFELGPQYHFPLEPQTTVVIPFEQGMQVFSATQCMDQTQLVIAEVLQLPLNAVQLQVRRLGGAFGFKISRGNQGACAAALAAFKLNCPVRFVQTIESMMSTSGKRWSCLCDYEFTAKSNGEIVTLSNQFWEDAGCTLGENPVKELSTLCALSCYSFTEHNYQLLGEAVLTDAPSNTWCRAPGAVEGIAMIENILERVAFETGVDPADARLNNILPCNKMSELLKQFLTTTEYRLRRQEIDLYNGKNRWRKRGLGLAIMEYPLIYAAQYSATVAIYQNDGTVVISHGGIEMGQGMNTKLAQVVAYDLKIPLSMVRVEASNTINGTNSFISGGSTATESLCYAVRKCCKILNARLQPIGADLAENAKWQLIIKTAYAKFVHLIASDHGTAEDVVKHNAYGLALCEVNVDILTGSSQVKRVDILEDVGQSLNPALDIGQIEGAFVMLLGYWLSEKLIYNRSTGQLLTNRTWTYKPPGAMDIPIDFRIELAERNLTPAGFMRSKIVSEPPSSLAVSSIFAIQHAVQSARDDAGLKRSWVRFGAPTTREDIFLAAGNDIADFTL